YGPKTGDVTLPPDHALGERRRCLAAMLDQGAVRVKQQLCVVDGPTIPLVDADGADDSRLSAGVPDGVGRLRRHRYRVVEQEQLLVGNLNGPLHRGEVWVIRHDRLGEGGELHTLVAKRNNLLDNLFHRPLAAVQHRTDLNRCGLDDCHLDIPFVLDATPVSLLRVVYRTIRLSALTSAKNSPRRRRSSNGGLCLGFRNELSPSDDLQAAIPNPAAACRPAGARAPASRPLAPTPGEVLGGHRSGMPAIQCS